MKRMLSLFSVGACGLEGTGAGRGGEGKKSCVDCFNFSLISGRRRRRNYHHWR